jgi:hypothetical protein
VARQQVQQLPGVVWAGSRAQLATAAADSSALGCCTQQLQRQWQRQQQQWWWRWWQQQQQQQQQWWQQQQQLQVSGGYLFLQMVSPGMETSAAASAVGSVGTMHGGGTPQPAAVCTWQGDASA